MFAMALMATAALLGSLADQATAAPPRMVNIKQVRTHRTAAGSRPIVANSNPRCIAVTSCDAAYFVCLEAYLKTLSSRTIEAGKTTRIASADGEGPIAQGADGGSGETEE
jgi:hypothetical protein